MTMSSSCSISDLEITEGRLPLDLTLAVQALVATLGRPFMSQSDLHGR